MSAGLGDRWLGGERIPGVAFAHYDTVRVVAGPHAGGEGRVLLLVTPPPEPTYLVHLPEMARPVRLAERELERT
jgi:hypothetical protein